MSNYTQKELEDFLALFRLTPYIDVVYIGKNRKLISDIKQFLSKSSGKLQTIESITTQDIRKKLKKSCCEYLILDSVILDSSNTTQLFELLSMTLRDSGHIILLENKNKDKTILYNLLEQYDYGAVSSVDIFQDYDLIIAKKLHMWGM